jgi:hypothetical protein
MNRMQRNALRRFRRVQEFLAANQVAGTAAQVQQLSEVIRQLTETGAEQDVSGRQSRGEVARQRALRKALWVHHLVPISRIARRMFGVPGMDVKFALPRYRADNEALIDAATGMAQAAEPHVAAFVQQGLPQDFVQQLRAATAAVSAAVGSRVQAWQRRSRAGETVTALLSRGRASVDMLDAIVSSRLESKPDLLAAWKSAKRLTDAGGGGAAPADPVDPEVKAA